MIREVTCQTAIDYEFPPDGGKVPVIDPYDGCQLNCAYCFQWQDVTWNKNILVKTNFPEVVIEELKDWDKSQPVYVGSRGDPYMPLEEKYQLTRKTLQILSDLDILCFINTKSNSKAFMRDIDVFQTFGNNLTICVGQTNLTHLRHTRDQRQLPNIETVNKLVQLGITTWAFITPVLPGITDVEMMVAALPETVPIYLDKVRLEADDKRFFAHIKKFYPELELRYHSLVATDMDPYYEKLKDLYKDDPRITFVFGEN